MATLASGNSWWPVVRGPIALLVLNAALTFENIWPTPAIAWRGAISIELAFVLLLAALAHRRIGPPSPRLIAVMSGAWVALSVGRYLEVTAPALYGRDVNLYWDLRFIPDVAAMVTKVAPAWLVIGGLGLAAVIVVALYRLFAWALSIVALAVEQAPQRRVVTLLAIALIVVFTLQRLSGFAPVPFPAPVTQTYARQIALVIDARYGSHSLPPTPDMTSSMTRVKDGDVLLVFIESYGAVIYRGDVAARLAPSRERLATDIEETRRSVASALVESPTFGGSSWLAHLSLMSGIEVRDPDTNALLMTQRRDTLVRAFSRQGYRTIALMPGLRQQWPEGSFYGFDEIYGADRLAYTGPEFGWFAIPDQFSMAKLDALERDRPTARRFVFFPTISTHFPFSPTPPYQPDWPRMFSARPYDGPDIVRAYAAQPDWTNFTPGYVEAIAYDLAVLGGYLRQWPSRPVTMILIGDHQPPAAVSGVGAPWSVPVHVITGEQAMLDRLKSRGFVDGLTPSESPVGPMHALLPMLLDAFGDHD